MRAKLLALLLVLWAVPLWAQQPVQITNVQAVDYTHDAALSLGTTSGPLGMCRTSAARPTVATGDTRAFAIWCNQYGAIHTIATDNAGNPATNVTNYYFAATASTNAQLVKNAAGSVYVIHATNTTSTVYYVRMYNLSAAPTCSSATGYVESIPVLPTSANGRSLSLGATYSTGIAYCITGGSAPTDNTSAAVGVYLYVGYF